MAPTQGYTVVGTAAHGQAVIDLVRAEKPDLVVLDIGMPDVDGLDALPVISHISSASRVIVHSAGLVPIVRKAVEMLGARAVDKATGLEGLAEAIRV